MADLVGTFIIAVVSGAGTFTGSYLANKPAREALVLLRKLVRKEADKTQEEKP